MFNKEVSKDKKAGLAVLLSGFLFAVEGFLATLNIHFEWLTEDSINAFVVLMVAVFQLVVTAFAVWKNTFTGKKAQRQNEELHKRRLK